MLHLMPVVQRFKEDHPLVDIEVQIANRYGDLFEQALDLAVRSRRVETGSSLTIRKLAEVDRIMVAAPDYLARRAAPPPRTWSITRFSSIRCRTIGNSCPSRVQARPM